MSVLLEEYVDLDTGKIVSHRYLQMSRETYKNSRFTDAELVGMRAASFVDPAQPGYRRTGLAVLVSSEYVREYADKTPVQIITEAKQQRDKNRKSVITVQNRTFDLDADSQINIREVLDNWDVAEQRMRDNGYSGPPGTIPWTLADDTDAQITKQELQAVREAGIKRAIDLHFQYRAVKAANQ